MTTEDRYRQGFILKCAAAGLSRDETSRFISRLTQPEYGRQMSKYAKDFSQEELNEFRRLQGYSDTPIIQKTQYKAYKKARAVARTLATLIFASQGGAAGFKKSGPSGILPGAALGGVGGLLAANASIGIGNIADRNRLKHLRKGEAPSWWTFC